jgi:hypothetical protein
MADKKVDDDGYVYEKDWLSGEYRRKENFFGQPVQEADFFGQPKKGKRAETWWGGDVKSERGRQLYEPKSSGGSDPVGDAAGSAAGCLLVLLLVGLFWLLGQWIKFCWRNPLVGLPIAAVVLIGCFLCSLSASGPATARYRSTVLPTYPNRQATAQAAGVLPPTRTPRPRSSPTGVVRQSAPAAAGQSPSVSTFPLKATPIAVAAEAKPLAIDFLIAGITTGPETLTFDIIVKRRSDTQPLPWFSDADRKEEIYLSIGSQRYLLIELGGLFTQDTTLQPGQSYQGWLTFERPGQDRFTFHYPDIKPLRIELEKLGLEQIVSGATPNPRPAVTPTASPHPAGASITCPKKPQGEFANLWQRRKEALGCPLANEINPLYGQFAELPFERGHLFWVGEIDGYGRIRLAIATFGGQNQGDTGAWLTHPENWNGEGICGVPSPPQGLYLPDRGLAKVWCEIDGLNRLGYATAPQEFVPNHGIDAIQNFEKAVVFRDSNGYSQGLVYILFRDSNSYVVVANK